MGDELHVVLGASGGIGSAVVAALSRRGLPWRAVNRSGQCDAPGGGEHRAADVSTVSGARHAVAGASVVYHCAQPPYPRWAAEFPPMTAAVADACQDAGAVLVFADNLYTYGPVEGPIGETSPQRPSSAKGAVRLAMADDLLARHVAGDLSVVLGRASDYFGPHGADSTPGALVFGPLAKGRKPRWMGSLDAPHTLHYLPDVGEALVTLAQHPQAWGRAWVLPAPPAMTGREWLTRAAAAAGRGPVKPSAVSPAMNRLGGLFVPMVRELNEIMYQFTDPFVVDDADFRSAFGEEARVTDVETALLETTRWFADAR